MKKSKSIDFWKYITKTKRDHVDVALRLDDFYRFFSNLEQDIFQSSNETVETFCTNHDFNADADYNGELDFPISVDEVTKAIKRLKRNKAYGIDCLLNEYFIECSDILSPYICKIFNAILVSGVFPESWADGIIIPLFKKGDRCSVANYRGITLLSCFSKLFNTLLNARITSFCEKYNLISDAQFGFRKGLSTTDAIFSLLSVVQNYLNNNKRLYVAFIDLKKCFDSIYRNALWYKLYNADIRGKVLLIIKNMYSHVK